MAWLKNGCLKGELLIFGPLNVGARSRKSMVLLTVLDIGGARDRSEDVNLHFHVL
ncbi:hypothetical protein [Mesorhizobium tianshanense]|uniref:hypothetical protein n=1 Tax=Mesorhizobium tianshanense TaxID=39844 RepID=UPI0012DC2644|nr:hypothetical protein [Mesorhizobium tianshanense]